jgi:hypothetical protein
MYPSVGDGPAELEVCGLLFEGGFERCCFGAASEAEAAAGFVPAAHWPKGLLDVVDALQLTGAFENV